MYEKAETSVLIFLPMFKSNLITFGMLPLLIGLFKLNFYRMIDIQRIELYLVVL